MSLKSTALFSILACLLALVPLAGCGPRDNTKRIILLTNGDDPFWDAMRSGMEKAADEFDLQSVGLKVEMDKNDGTSKGQIDKLKQYTGQSNIAAVAISVTDADNGALAQAMDDLAAAGVKVITIDSDINRDKFRESRFAYIGTDNIIAGQELGKATKGLRPDGGTYATFYGLSAAANVIERQKGFQLGAGDSFKKVDSLSDNMNLSTAQANVRNALQNHPEIDTLVGIWAYNAHAIVEVVKQNEIREATTIVVFDAAPKALQHMNDGMIDAMLVQNPYEMGYLGTKLMKALVTDDTAVIKEMYPEKTDADGDIYITGLRVVVPNGDSRLKQEMFIDTTEFYTADEFDAWLKERSLIGS